jgi:hypothetical protein
MRNAYKTLLGKPKEKKPFEIPRFKCENIIERNRTSGGELTSLGSRLKPMHEVGNQMPCFMKDAENGYRGPFPRG